MTRGEQALAKGGGGSPTSDESMAGGSRELVQSLALPINELDAQQTLLLGKEEAAGANNIGHRSLVWVGEAWEQHH